MDLDDPADFTELSNVIKGFSNDTRIALLLGLRHGYTIQEIADFLDMTRGGLQNNIYKMIDSDLVYRPSDDDAPPYQLTPLGHFFARQLNKHGEAILEARELLSETEDRYAREVADSPLSEGMSEPEQQKIIHTKKWSEVGKEVDKMIRRAGKDPFEALKQNPTSISEIIVKKIAEREDVKPRELQPPLYSAIDVDALDRLMEKQAGNTDFRIQFTYQGYLITVIGAGEVDVSDESATGMTTEEEY